MKTAPLIAKLETLDQRGLFWKTGILGVFLIALGMFISAVFYRGRSGEPYTPLNHFVSELGEVGIAPMSAAFNVGLILGGLCMVVSVCGLALRVGGRWGVSLGLVGLFCGASGTLVGVFPMNNLFPHVFWSMNFFNSGLLIMLIFSLAVLFGRRGLPKWLALPSLLPVFAFSSFLFLPQPFQPGEDPLAAATASLVATRPPLLSMAIFEWLAVLSIMLWALILALALRPRQAEPAYKAS